MAHIKQVLDTVAPREEEPINLFEGVELSLEETEEALRLARQAKFFKAKREEYFERITATKSLPLYSADVALAALKKTRSANGEQYQIDDSNFDVIVKLCLYFSGDKLAETKHGLKLNKGILLIGPPGVGKTHLMTFFRSNPLQSFVNPTCTSIENKWVNNGNKEPFTINDIGIIDYYSNVLSAPNDEPYLHQDLGVCFEDLGSRDNPTQKRFGEDKNVMQEIIFNRYSNRIPYNQTHFTSNLGATELATKYGERVRDRLREMCNVLTLTGKSRRV